MGGTGWRANIPGPLVPYEISLWSAVSLLEVLPKDKKAKEEKTAILGQACVDLLPLLLTTEHPLKLTVKLLADGSETTPEEAVSLVCSQYQVQLSPAKIQLLHNVYVRVEVYVVRVYTIRAQHVTID